MGVQIVKLLGSAVEIAVNLNPRGEYDNATAYATGDSVSYQGSSYVALGSTTGNLPTNTSFWQLLAEKGDTGATGAAGATGATGAAGADGADGVVQTVVAGTGISVDSTDPANPIVTNTQTSAVWGAITGTLSSQTDLQTALDGKVNDTGDETIGGVKTFSSDPVVPDEVYGVGWNGSLEVPTKNALYDKIETLGTGGGQSTYDAIVAPSGGDYTTLGAAIAAASAGWRIFVKTGTYSESAISTALNNLTIDGAGGENSIIALTTVACTFSGTGVTLKNIGFTASTGYLHMTGAEANLESVLWDSTDIGSSQASIYMNGARSKITSSILKCTLAAGTPARPFIFLNAIEQNFENNYVTAPVRSTSTSAGVLYLGSARECSVVGNKFVSVSDAAGGICIMNNAGLRSTITGNAHQYADNAISTFAYYSTASRSVFSGNTVRARVFLDALANIASNNYVQSTNTSNVGIHISDNECVVADNYIEVSGTSTVGVTVDSACSNAVITGNRFGTPATGVSIAASSCVNCSIIGNNFSGVTTTPISDSGLTTIIKNNQGVDINNEKSYLRMKNTSGLSVAAGDLVTLKAVAAGDEFTTTTSGGDNKVIGMATATITNNSYGYIQVEGKTTLMKVDGTTDIAIGDYISTFTTAGIGKKATAGETAIAIALEAYTTDNSSGVIDALIISPRLI
jgi:hypothetical protein